MKFLPPVRFLFLAIGAWLPVPLILATTTGPPFAIMFAVFATGAALGEYVQRRWPA